MTTYTSLSTPGVLLADAAASFERVRKELAAAGIKSGTSHAIQATRTCDQQVALFVTHYTRDKSQRLHYPIDARWWRGNSRFPAGTYYRRRGFAAAAIPCTSNHGDGRTVDWQGLGGYATKTWQKARPILERNGWNNQEGRSVNEPWHWTYVKSNDNNIPAPEPDNFTNNMEDGMGNWKRRWFDRYKDFDLEPDKWTTIFVKDNDDISIAFGPADPVDGRVNIQVSGLPKGEQIQVRFFIDEVKDGKTSRAHELRRDLHEAVGTDGTTFVNASTITGLASHQRLRAEVWVPASVKGAKVIYAGAASKALEK